MKEIQRFIEKRRAEMEKSVQHLQHRFATLTKREEKKSSNIGRRLGMIGIALLGVVLLVVRQEQHQQPAQETQIPS